MDTDDLSDQTYKAIILESEKFNPNLTLQFGVLASNCTDDDDYLNQVENMIQGWLNKDEFDEVIMDIFFDQIIDKQKFVEILIKILSSIREIRKIPMDQREFEDWD